MDNYSLMALILALIGLLVVCVELFVPSGGLLGILSATCFFSSLYCAYRAWYVTGHHAIFVVYVVSMLVLIPTVIGTTLYWLPRTKWGQNMFAMPQSLDELTPFVEEEQRLRELVHQRGKAVTMFSPGGIASVGNQKYHAESEGMLIESGDPIVVVGVKANRLVVRPATLYDAAAPSVDNVREAVIDFDLPENA